VAQESWQMSS